MEYVPRAGISAKAESHYREYLKDLKIYQTDESFVNYDESISKPKGVLKSLPVKFRGIETESDLFVFHKTGPPLISRQWLEALQLWPSTVPRSKMHTLQEKQKYIKYSTDTYKTRNFSKIPGAFVRQTGIIQGC